MHDLLSRQIEKCTAEDGSLRLEELLQLVEGAYADFNRTHERTVRSIQNMASENQSLTTKLTETVRRLSEAQRIGSVGDFWFCPTTREVFLSETAAETCRMPAVETYLHVDHFLDHLGNAEKERVFELFDNTNENSQITQSDITLKAKDGSQRTFLLTVRMPNIDEKNPDGRYHGTIQDITDRKSIERDLERLAFYDTLTNLPNRSRFKSTLQDWIDKADDSFALMLLDIDNFKEINDLYGHSAGDKLLVAFSDRLSTALPDNCFCARLAGDEFAVLVPKCGGQQCPLKVAELIRDSMQPFFQLDDIEVSVKVSMGVAGFPRHAGNQADLFRFADIALYEAKMLGRNQCALFKPTMREKKDAEVKLLQELRTSVRSNSGLMLYYQPQIERASGRVSGFEALLRWKHKDMGFVPPSNFIPLAERSSLIVEIGDWVLDRAIHQISEWNKTTNRRFRVSVNISAAHLKRIDFVINLSKLLAKYNVSPRQICIELTESVRADFRDKQFLGVLDGLKKLGVSLALDDFGTDYSSLAYLTHLPFDEIKIDKLFIQRAECSEQDKHVLTHIVSLTAGLHKRVVAEGAETHNHVELAIQSGCSTIQGWFYSKAVPPESVESTVEQIEQGRLSSSAA